MHMNPTPAPSEELYLSKNRVQISQSKAKLMEYTLMLVMYKLLIDMIQGSSS